MKFRNYQSILKAIFLGIVCFVLVIYISPVYSQASGEIFLEKPIGEYVATESSNQISVHQISSPSSLYIPRTFAQANANTSERNSFLVNILNRIERFFLEYQQVLLTILLDIVYAILATLALWLAIKNINKYYPRVYTLIKESQGTKIKDLKFQKLVILTAKRMVQAAFIVARVVYWTIIFACWYLYIPFVLNLTPWTKDWSKQLFQVLFAGITNVSLGIIGYLPKLITIVIILAVTFFIVRLAKRIFTELGKGTINFPGFDPIWAKPTYNICFLLIIALAIALIFPHLPGDEGALQGVSVFVGVLVSLGSTAVVANAMAGIILIYSRAFEVGDHVNVAGTRGDIVEKAMLFTRLRTPRNMMITIPNSMVLANFMINFTTAAEDTDNPFMLHTTITLGYDVPWRKVHEVLIKAASDIEDILDEPEPFVLQTALNDFYVSYEINAYTRLVSDIAIEKAYSQLHQNIQDLCNEADIEILSPHYSAIRDGHQTTIPENYLPKDYIAPGFRFDPLAKVLNSGNHELGNKS